MPALLVAACGGEEAPPVAPAPAPPPAEVRAQEIERLRKLSSGDARLLYQAGLSLIQLGEHRAALEKLEAAREQAPEIADIHRSLWLVNRLLGRPQDALAALEEAVRLDPVEMQTTLSLVQAYTREGRLAEARTLVDTLAEAHDGTAPVQAALGALAAREGDPARARVAFERALAIDPREPEAHFELGMAARRQGDLDEAGTHFTITLEEEPEHMGALMGLGSLGMDREDYEEAAMLFLRAIQLDPRYFPARRSLGNALLLQGLFDEAVLLFEQGVDLTPRNLDAHHYLGKAYMQRGFLDKAEREYEFVARSAPDRLGTDLELIRLYSLRGEITRAFSALKQAIQLGFDDFAILQRDPDFENLLAASPVRSFLEDRERERGS